LPLLLVAFAFMAGNAGGYFAGDAFSSSLLKNPLATVWTW
jgi:hypothetical protein